MSRKLTGGLAAAAAALAIAVAASSAFSTGAGEPPKYGHVTIDLSGDRAAASARPEAARAKSRKPRLVYLQSSAPEAINPADQPTGVGPYVDIKLTGCSKVIDGGVVPFRSDVYVQGSYVENRGTYHVLIALDDDSLMNRTPFNVSSSITCLKGVK